MIAAPIVLLGSNIRFRILELKVFIDQNKLITNHDRVFKAISRSYYSIISGCNIIDSSQAN